MGIYINGLDFHSSASKSAAGQSGLTAVESRLGSMRAVAADFRFVEKLGSTVSGLATMYDREDGAEHIVYLATLLQRRALVA